MQQADVTFNKEKILDHVSNAAGTKLIRYPGE